MRKRIMTLIQCLLLMICFNTSLLAQQIGDYHALFIAIDDYNSSTIWKPLNTPVKDANAVQQVLIEKYGFKTITNLYNEEATRAKIFEKLEELTKKLGENDNLLIYFSGHGIEIGSDGYWVPYDAKSQERYDLLATSEVKTMINSVSCKHVLIMVDACFSSTIFKTASSPASNSESESYYVLMERLLSRQAITAGGLEPVPDGIEDHSVFAKYIIKFLEKNTKSNISGDELYELIKYPVAANSPNTPQFGHLQNTGHEGGQFIFRLQEKKLCNIDIAFEQGTAISFDSDGGTLTPKTNIDNGQYVWTLNDKVLENKSKSLKVTEAGKYTVTAIDTKNDCFATATVDVTLNKSENNTNSINSSVKLSICSGENLPPFSETNAVNGGMITEIVTTVFDNMNQPIDKSFVPNNQMKSLTFGGTKAICYPLTKNKKDERLFLYSEPLHTTLNVFFAKENSKVADVEKTMKKRMKKKIYQELVVAVTNHYLSDKLIQYAEDRYIIIKTFKSLDECFEALENGQVDLVAGPQIAGLFTIEEHTNLKPQNFKILEQPIESCTLHIAVSKNHPEGAAIIKNFNTALQNSIEDKTIKTIIDKHLDLVQKTKP